MPSPAPQLVVFGGRIYAFGDDVSVYDPTTDKWTIVARIEMPRFESAVVAYRDEIWLIGGHGVRGDDRWRHKPHGRALRPAAQYLVSRARSSMAAGRVPRPSA